MDEHEMQQAEERFNAVISSKILDAIHGSQYYLLIGAGASFGEKNSSGNFLPGAKGLLEGMKSYYDIDDKELQLQQTADIINEIRPIEKQSLDDYLTNVFSGCTYSWQNIIFDFNWNIIWTLNIDDVLETAANNNSEKIHYKSYTWKDAYANEQNYFQIVHLHGQVGHKPTSDFVFSTTQYADAFSSNKTWHHIFSDTFPVKPYIILGSTLSNEYDLSQAISKLQSRLDNSLPTILILPDLNSYIEQSLIKKGIIILKMPGEVFFRFLRKKYLQNIHTRKVESTAYDFLFGQQFEKIPFPKRISATHDFYAGHEPTIQDIIEYRDAIIDKTVELRNSMLKSINLDSTLDEDTTRLYIVEGLPGSGKTTSVMRTVFELTQKGHECFRFLEPEETDLESIIGFCSNKTLVLLFDNIGSYRFSMQ